MHKTLMILLPAVSMLLKGIKSNGNMDIKMGAKHLVIIDRIANLSRICTRC